METVPLRIKEECINCEGEISSARLDSKLPCEKDLLDEEVRQIIKIRDELEFLSKIHNKLLEKNRLFKFKDIYKLEKNTREFINLFKNLIGFDPWSIQVAWFKRLLRNESFSMIAPTGIGKTTFIVVSSIFLALKNKKVYIILPTSVLVEQVYSRISNFLEKVGKNISVVAYTKKFRKEAKEKIMKVEFDILITSNQFLSRNFEILKDISFDVIFVDDVDAFFKSSKNVERVLNLLGFSNRDIELAYKLIKAKQSGKENEILELSKEIEEVKKRKHGCLVLSSATGKVSGQRVKLYRELLNFSVGSGTSKIRNIVDVFLIPEKDEKEILLELIKILKDGILIFVPRDKGASYAQEIYNFLKDNEIKVGLAISEYAKSSEDLKKFAESELNVLVGVAHFYGLLVRGLDLPTRVKYVIFLGIPKIRVNLTKKEKSVQNTIILARILQDVVNDEKLRTLLRSIQNRLRRLSVDALRMLSESFKEGKNLEGWLETLRKDLEELDNIVSDYLKSEETLRKIKEHPDVSLKVEEDIFLQIPDVKTYIQASGRASRLYAGGITKGLSIVIVDDEKLLRSLERKLKLYFD